MLMKFKKLLASLLSFVTLFTMTAPTNIVFAENSDLNLAEAKEYFVGPTREYKTINAALDKVKENPPTGEDSRATINIDPGTYEEQVVIGGNGDEADNLSYVTIQKTPDMEGEVNWSWYYCTGYCFSNVGLNGRYDPKVDWFKKETWEGYNQGDEKFTKYEIGQSIAGVTKISYYDTDGVAHKDAPVNGNNIANLGNSGENLDAMGAFSVRKGSHDITLKNVHIVNSIPVMCTQGEKDAHITPTGTLPTRNCLSVCDENTEEISVAKKSDGKYDLTKTYSAGESAYLAKSSLFNERGHALSICGDRITLENVYARGNQDSVYIAGGRIYFKECNLIGGTDYIYGSSTAVFDNCKLGLAGMSDKSYGAPIATPQTPTSTKYGYLFYGCTIYNVRNNNGANNFGGSWNSDGQSTFYNTTLDNGNSLYGKSKEVIIDAGWNRFGVQEGKQRMYEYGTKNADGTSVDTSKRLKNVSVEEGGPGMGTVIDEWQVLEFNPRNYFSADNGNDWNDDWDPMNFGANLNDVDAQIEAANITVPVGNDTTITLPEPTDSNIEFKWESISNNAVVSADGKSIEVIRPAIGEEPINTSVILYARNKTSKFGDKKVIDVTISPTTDGTNVFNIPVTVKQSVEVDTACEYTITITKNGALIKQTKVTVPAGEKTVSDTIENVPANASGIEYDIKIVPSSNEFAVAVPEDGQTKLNGKTGVDIPLEINSKKAVDETINANVSYSYETGAKSFDLIALAKANGAGADIDTSDILTVEYDLDIVADGGSNSYIDLTSRTPDSTYKDGADSSRFVGGRIYPNWHQMDMASCGTKFYGTNANPNPNPNVKNQCLNIVGKFDYSTTSHISATIDFKTKNVSIKGVGTSTNEYSFDEFPENAQKGSLYLAIYPESTKATKFTVSNVEITYKKVVTSSDGNESDSTSETTTNSTSESTTESTQPTTSSGGGNADSAAIVNAEVSNGSTVVTLENIANGVLVATKHTRDGKVEKMKTADVTGNDVTVDGIEADSVFVWDSLSGMKPLTNTYSIKKESKEFNVDFTGMTEVPVYSKEKGQGFVSQSSAIMSEGFERSVAGTDKIKIDKGAASVTEDGNGDYINKTSDFHNNGGLIYRIDTAPGAYHIEVEVTGTSSDTLIAPTGMNSGDLTGTKAWDTAGLVNRVTSASWEGSVWSYDYVSGNDFVEIDIEPAKLPGTVGVKSIKVTSIDNNPAGDKPTIHILGDSTQKTYTFFSTISSWGQTLIDYFDPERANVVNYSMGGRSMKANYTEGRADDVLMRGKVGDFVFIHSAHNDESIEARFGRGGQVNGGKGTLEQNNALYDKWLDFYVKAIKSRGMTPVLVTSMPRTGNGRFSEDEKTKPNGFNPDSPGNMRKKAASDSEVGLVELYDGAKEYILSLEANEILGIYNSIEAGETPAASDGSSQANGPEKNDGTHYREAAARQWCRIMLQSMYDQSVASTDKYTDKDIMKELVSYMKADVREAVVSKDWSKVFPEMALDVSAKGIVPGAAQQPEENYYYRNAIEKLLQLGIMQKDSSNKFYPTSTITVGDFARSVEKAFGLEANSLTNYNKTYAQLQAEGTVTPLSSDDNAKSKDENADINIADASAGAKDGEFTVTVTQPEGGKVTIYNESDYVTQTANIGSGVKVSQVISDNSYFKLTAPETLGKDGSDKTVFSGNSQITGDYIQYRRSSTTNFIPIYTAKQSGNLILYTNVAANKKAVCEEKIEGTVITKGPKQEVQGTGSSSELTFKVEAGKEYYLYTDGGTGQLYGVQFATDYKSSTESLSVKSGTQIRVVAERSTVNYQIDGITVDGKKVSSEREYTFAVTGDTKVSAILSKIQEPDLVSETIIPSDAKLTRQAMSAVLYDAYILKYGDTTNEKRPSYMTKHNGTSLSPDDPNYDPNITPSGGVYYPLTDWFSLKDRETINNALYQKVKGAYNLGLVRADVSYPIKGADGKDTIFEIKRGVTKNGEYFIPEQEVTRAKAAKALAFIYVLTQNENDESQVLPNGNLAANTGVIAVPNENAPTVPIEIK